MSETTGNSPRRSKLRIVQYALAIVLWIALALPGGIPAIAAGFIWGAGIRAIYYFALRNRRGVVFWSPYVFVISALFSLGATRVSAN